MKNVAVMGASGRMGQEVIKHLQGSKSLNFQTGIAEGSDQFLNAPSDISSGGVDIVIDFSLPSGFDAISRYCLDNKIPLVSGTTGLDDTQLSSLKEIGRKIPILWSPNMSIGIAFVSHLLKQFGSIKDFDFGIEELHHSQKKDSPSGTAIHLKYSLESAIEKSVDQVVDLRGGGIFGIHKIWAMSPDETITIEHTALNRSVFAAGAVKAAEWLVNQEKGHYSLADVLESKA